jgi:hypothetical protein
MYISVYIDIYVCICIYVYIYLYMYENIYMYACIDTYTHVLLSITRLNMDGKERIEDVEYMQLNIPRHNLKY